MFSVLVSSRYNSNQNESDENKNIENERERKNYQTIGERNIQKHDDNSFFHEFMYLYQVEEKIHCTTNHPNINLLLYLACYIMFLLFGALIFMMIEQPQEVSHHDLVKHLRENFLTKYPFIKAQDLNILVESILKVPPNFINSNSKHLLINKSNSIPNGSLAQLSSNLSAQNLNLVNYKNYQTESLLQNKPTNEKNVKIEIKQDSKKNGTSKWKFTSSLLFVTSLVTTIGYGNIAPSTNVGKVFCIIFCSVGIPATLTLLSAIVTRLVRGPVKCVEALIINIIFYLHRCSSLFTIRLLHLLTITTILLFICFFIPAYIFFVLENNWSYLDCLYYCFISLTTIGLGDLIPASDNNENSDYYIILTILYLYFGLCLIMLWLALVYRIPQFNINQLLISTKVKHDLKTKERLRIMTNNS